MDGGKGVDGFRVKWMHRGNCPKMEIPMVQKMHSSAMTHFSDRPVIEVRHCERECGRGELSSCQWLCYDDKSMCTCLGNFLLAFAQVPEHVEASCDLFQEDLRARYVFQAQRHSRNGWRHSKKGNNANHGRLSWGFQNLDVPTYQMLLYGVWRHSRNGMRPSK